MNTQYNLLIQKLDRFIRKYYANQILKGLIVSAALYLLFYLTVTILEYFGNFSVPVRTALFFLVLLIFGFILIRNIIVPVLNFFKIGRVINHRQAAEIISRHFTDMQDRLLNTLELASIEQNSDISYELLMASIEQRIEEMKPIPFQDAIRVKENLKYAKYLAAVVVAFLAIYFLSPQVLQTGTYRFINYDKHFEPQAPFSFHLATDSLTVERGGDFSIQLELRGEYIPNQVSIHYGGNDFVMEKDGKRSFTYDFKNINNSLDLYFSAEEFQSEDYTLRVLPTPLVLNFEVSYVPPAYTGEKPKTVSNVGDFSVPAGTRFTWQFFTKDIDSLNVVFSDSLVAPASRQENGFSLNKAIYKTTTYKISAINSFFKNDNILKYTINALPDLYPEIMAQSLKDSTNHTVFYFNGNISDDYGFSKLTFNYKIQDAKKQTQDQGSIKLPINTGVSAQEYFYMFDFSALELQPEQNVIYFFEVWDNDMVSGAKSARTQTMEFRVPSVEELQQIEETTNENVKDKIAESQKLINELQKDVNDLKRSLVDESTTDWEKVSMLNKINAKQKKLDSLLEEMAKENKEKNEMINTFSEEEKEIMEKQKQLEEMLENIMDDELKELIEEIQKLQEKFDPKKFNELSEKLDMTYDDLSKQLDRNMEIMKRYEVEQKVNKTAEQLEKLAEEQQELSEQSKDRSMSEEELSEKQKEQAEKFEELMEDYKEAQEKNQELKSPMNLDDFQQQKQDIQQEFQQGQQQLQNGKRRKASQSQQQNSQNLQQLSQKMQQMMQQNMMQQQSENIDDMRQVIDNLVSFSFEQEEIMENFSGLSRRDPKFVKLTNQQFKLNDDFAIVEDSLHALASRVAQLSTVITKELSQIKTNMKNIQEQLQEGRRSGLQARQQHIMTSANDLALLLSEVLQQMMQQMQSMQSGNPKDGRQGQQMPSLSQMKSQQESLKKQLENYLKQLKQNGGKMDPNAMNKRLAQMLAQQEIYRQMLNKMKNNGSLQQETKQILSEISKMIEQTERDLANKNVTRQTLERQKKILTRLLEAENAENQREKEKKRQSKTAENNRRASPEDYFKNKRNKEMFKESLKSNDLKLYNFYKNKYSDYLLKLNEQ